MHNGKRELGNKNESTTKKLKLIIRELKQEQEVNGVTEEIAENEDAGSTLGTCPEELRDGRFINVSKESGCEEMGDVPEAVTLASKNSQRYFMT